MRRVEPFMPALLLVSLLFAAGCGGGASATTTVTYLPSKPAEAAATGEPGTGAASGTETVAAGGIGSIKGKIVYQGEAVSLPPKYPKGAAPKDPAVCGVEAVPDETVIVNNGGLANVFVYLGKAPAGAVPPASTDPVIFDQKYCVFKPHALVVRTSQPVRVLNDDAALHNTHTYPKRNTGFNQGVQPNDRTGVDLVYAKAESEPFQVGCDVHPWMIAYHLPVDHPFAAVSGTDGTFEIKDIPAGKHQFKVWHEKGGVLEKGFAITVKAGETVEIEIPVAASKLAGFQVPPAKVIQLSSLR
jgi:hypothetical protein